MIAPQTTIADRQKRVALFTPGAPVPDGDGGYTQAETPLDPPALFAHVRAASARDLERLAGSTTLPTATHLVSLPFHAGVTTETVLKMENHPRAPRVLKVVFISNPDERSADLELICAEQIA
jgi:head-tail adaptor